MPLLTDKPTDKPTIDDLAAKAETTYAQRKARRNERHGTQAAETSGKEEAVVIPESKALNLPESVRIGSLGLVLVCPKMGKSLALQQKIFTGWPDLLLFAVTGDMEGKGIDPAAVRDMWAISRHSQYEEYVTQAKADGVQESDVEPYQEPSLADVRAGMSRLSMALETYLPTICDTLWEVAGTTPGLHWPVQIGEDEQRKPLPEGAYLDTALMDNLTLPEFADCLRAILGCLGGFTGDCRDRFPGSI